MIYLVRHGEDDERYVGGWSNVDLTQNGIKQVEEVARFIKEQNFNIDKIITSDIKRAITTAMIIAKVINVEIELSPSLRELNKGDLNGMLVEMAKIRYPQYFTDVMVDTRYPNGESMIDLHERSRLIVNAILKTDNKLYISHRGIINDVYRHLNQLEPTMNKKQFGVTHASLHELNPNTKVIKKIR